MTALKGRDALLSRRLGQEWPHEPLLRALHLPRQLEVLEVGTVEGRLLNFLAGSGHTGRLIGLDPQPGAGVQVGEAEHLPFPAYSFDVVLMVRMLTHCQNPIQALNEARRVLRPQGRVVIALHGHEHLQAALQATLGGAVPLRELADDVQDIFHNVGMEVRRHDVKEQVSLTLQDARALLTSYGQSHDLREVVFPLADTLHLTLFQA